MIDLSVNVPPPMLDEAMFLEASARASAEALALPSGGLYHQNGTPRARSVMAGWLARSGVEVPPDELILCNGAQQAIYLAFADLARHSRLIASEGATYSGAIAAAAHLGLDWQAVAHDDEGMLPGDLDRVLHDSGCRTVFTTPVCQNPIGFETGEARRGEIVEVCRRHDAYIVEDDIYAIYAAKGRVTYRRLAPERTYYLTSISKSVTPLPRLGVLVPPAGRMDALLRAMRAETFGAAPMAIELGCALIELGADTTAAQRLRDEAKARIECARNMLSLRDLPMPEASPHIWLPMEWAEAQAYAARAEAAGVSVTRPEATAIDPAKASGIRLCLIAPERREDVEQALRKLAAL